MWPFSARKSSTPSNHWGCQRPLGSTWGPGAVGAVYAHTKWWLCVLLLSLGVAQCPWLHSFWCDRGWLWATACISFKLLQTGWVLGRNHVELESFTYKVGLGTGKHWEGEVLKWSSFVGTVSIMVWRSWLSPWWKTSVLSPLLEGQMAPQCLVLTIEHKIGTDLQFDSSAWLSGFVWDFCGALKRLLFLSSARTTFSISSQAQDFAVIIMQFHLG